VNLFKSIPLRKIVHHKKVIFMLEMENVQSEALKWAARWFMRQQVKTRNSFLKFTTSWAAIDQVINISSYIDPID